MQNEEKRTTHSTQKQKRDSHIQDHIKKQRINEKRRESKMTVPYHCFAIQSQSFWAAYDAS